jgi:hypothetical protein
VSEYNPILQADFSLPEDLEANPIRPWERLPRESDNQWSYFLCFRDMAYPNGPSGDFNTRNVSALAAALGVSRNYLYKLQTSFKWQIRAGAYDRMLDAAKTEASMGEVAKIQRRQSRLLSKGETLLELELEKLIERAQANTDEGAMAPREVIALMQTVLKWRRIVSGQSTQNVAVTRWNLDALSLEELEILAKAEERAALTDGASTEPTPPPIPFDVDVESDD